jgi:hypothetical protein
MLIDRRSGRDRRSVERFSVNINAEWKVSGARNKGTINDISTRGCFVACSGEIENGTGISLFLILKNGVRLPFSGEVVNNVFEIGFGVKFVDLKEEQKSFLAKLISTLQKKYRASAN